MIDTLVGSKLGSVPARKNGRILLIIISWHSIHKGACMKCPLFGGLHINRQVAKHHTRCRWSVHVAGCVGTSSFQASYFYLHWVPGNLSSPAWEVKLDFIFFLPLSQFLPGEWRHELGSSGSSQAASEINQFPCVWDHSYWGGWLLELTILGLLYIPLPTLKEVVVFIEEIGVNIKESWRV